MRMLLLSVLIGIGLIIGGVSLFATWNNQTQQVGAFDITADITGNITAIDGDLLSVRDEEGVTHFIMVTYPKALEGLKVRDSINMKIERGAVVSIEKAEGKTFLTSF